MFPKCFPLSTAQMWKMLSKQRTVTRAHADLPLLGLLYDSYHEVLLCYLYPYLAPPLPRI